MIVNWAALAALGSLAAVIAAIWGAAYTSGKVTQSVVDLKEKTADLSETVKDHGETLTEHGEAIAGLQARPRYVNGSGH